MPLQIGSFNRCDICFGPLPCPEHSMEYAPQAPSRPWHIAPPTRGRNMRKFGKASYQMLARTMQDAHGVEPISGTAEVMWQNTCNHLACTLANDSQYFQTPRFLAACKPGADVAAVLRTEISA